MELIPSFRRRPSTHLQIDDAGQHVFRRDKIQNNNHYYRCTVKNCPSRAVLNDGIFTVSEKTSHNHDPPDVAATVAKWMSRNKGDLTPEDFALQESIADILYDDASYIIPTTSQIAQSSSGSIVSVDNTMCILTQTAGDPKLTVSDVRSLASCELVDVKEEHGDLRNGSPEHVAHDPLPDEDETLPERPDISRDNPVTYSGTAGHARKKRKLSEAETDTKEDLETEVLLATRRKLEAERCRAEAEAAFWSQEEKQSAAMTRLLEEQRKNEVVRRKLLVAELEKKRPADGERTCLAHSISTSSMHRPESVNVRQSP